MPTLPIVRNHRLFIGRSRATVSSFHSQFSVDFTTNIAESDFLHAHHGRDLRFGYILLFRPMALFCRANSSAECRFLGGRIQLRASRMF
jgi:hypothetical protein